MGLKTGLFLMMDDDRFPLAPGKTPVMLSVRFGQWTVISYERCAIWGGEPKKSSHNIFKTTSERQGRTTYKTQSALREVDI